MKPTDFFRALDLPADPLKPGFRRPRASRSNHYAVFNAEEILTEAFIGSATLVRTNLPHAVENTDSARGRWALSVRFEPDFKSWAAANAALKPLWATPHRPSRLSISSP